MRDMEKALLTTRREMEKALLTTRRRMICKMFGGKCRYIDGKADETWIEYIKRSAHKAEDVMEKCGSQD